MLEINSVKDVQKHFGSSNNDALISQEQEKVCSNSENLISKVKLREFKQNTSSYRNGTYYLIDGKGEIAFTVISGKHESISSGLTHKEKDTLNDMYAKVEKIESFMSKHDY
jgi:hypothetical protein